MAGRKTLLAPIHYIFSLLQKRATVQIWLYEQLAFRIEGKIRVRVSGPAQTAGPLLTCQQGFDEFMNLVIDDAVEVRQATKTESEKRRALGKSIANPKPKR